MPEKLTRAKIHQTLRRAERISELARSLGITPTTVSSVLRGKGKSARVMEAAERMAIETMEREAVA